MRPIYLQWWRQNPRMTYTFQGQKNLPTSSKAYLQGSHVDCQVLYQIWEASRTVGEVRGEKTMAAENGSEIPGVSSATAGVSAANSARWISWHLWKLRSQLGWNHQPTYDVSGQHLSTHMVLCKAPSAPISGESNGLSLAVAISGLSASHFFPHWARSIWCILGLSKVGPISDLKSLQISARKDLFLRENQHIAIVLGTSENQISLCSAPPCFATCQCHSNESKHRPDQGVI